MRAVLVWVAAVAALVATAAEAADAVRSRLEEGRAIYNYRCYFCHGYSGNAQTLAATFLIPSPTDFTRAEPTRFTAEHVAGVLRAGKPGTAMKSFVGMLSPAEIDAVAGFVFSEFVVRKDENTRYHTPENGWADHARYQSAFPFARGEIPLSRSWESLTPEQVEGKRLYLSTCISCHDRGAAEPDPVIWEGRPLSYPRNHYSPAAPPVDAITSASPYAKHDVRKRIAGLTPLEKRGERLFLVNCAFCHGADGTGKNWIGSFMEPHPRDLTDPAFMSGMTRERLTQVIRDGLPGTSMPAWKSVLAAQEIRAIVAYVGRALHRLTGD